MFSVIHGAFDCVEASGPGGPPVDNPAHGQPERSEVRSCAEGGPPRTKRDGVLALTVRFPMERETMAARKSAQQVAAREKARQKAADFTARHEELIELATKFIEFDEAAENTEAAAREKAEKIIQQGSIDAEAARRDAGQVVSQMLETGESKSAVAARLGLTPASLKKYLPAPAGDTTPAAPKAEPETAPSAEGVAG